MAKYDPIRDYLVDSPSPKLRFKFAEIERILGTDLPPSARSRTSGRSWWSNSDGHVQAEAWMAAGWVVAFVDVAQEMVVFQRDYANMPEPRDPFEQGRHGDPYQPSGDRASYRDAYFAGALARIASAIEAR